MSLFNIIGGIFLFWAAYLFFFTPSAGLLFVFGKKRAAWIKYDYLLAVLPCFFWIMLFFSFPGRKDIGNIGELIVLGMLAPLLLLVRLFYATKKGYAALSLINLVVCCGAAVVMFFTVQLIPEH